MLAGIPFYSLPSSSWPFSIQDVVQPLTLQVQRPLVSVVSACWTGNLWDLGECFPLLSLT